MASVASEPAPAMVGLHELKALLRIDGGAEDALLAGFLRSAWAACETFTGLLLVARPGEEMVEADRRWRRLAAAPVQAIEQVEAPDGAALPVEQWAVDIDADGNGWVRAMGDGERRVRARFRAGLAADWNGVPEPLRHGIVRLAAHLYTAREDGAPAPPAAVAALWRPWRRLRIG
jgi:uncharacterized phiE125 gp8 family phage protein